jgi:DNA-binding NarL/FixJ family response regulator
VKPRLRLLLVEDHPLVREAVRGVLDAGEMQVVGEAATADAALSQALLLRPDVIVLDVDLRGESAVPIISELHRRLPEATVVILTASTSDRLVVEAVEAGARGFLTKDMDGETLRRSILGAARGELAMTRRRSRLVTDHLAMRRERSPLELGLTERELEIIRMVAEGLTDREIAEALVLSRRTVEGHVARLIHKLGSRNRTEAAARYRSLT